jgi:hypothetical protein
MARHRGGGKEALPDQRLTRESPAVSAWPEMGRRWWNRRRRSSGTQRETAPVTGDGGLGRRRTQVRRRTCRGATAAAGRRHSEQRRQRDDSVRQPAGVYLFSAQLFLSSFCDLGEKRGGRRAQLYMLGPSIPVCSTNRDRWVIGPGWWHEPGPMTWGGGRC